MISERCCLGIDLDNVPRWRMMQVYFNLKSAFPAEEIIVYRTRHGYHIKLPAIRTDLELRRVFGDDPWRIDFEEARCKALNRKPQDILFNTKTSVYYGNHKRSFTRERINILSEPFNSQVVRK